MTFNPGGYLRRWLAQDARELQARGACVVAVPDAAGPPKLEVGQVALDSERAHGLDQRSADAAADPHPPAFSRQQEGCSPASVNSTWVEMVPRV